MSICVRFFTFSLILALFAPISGAFAQSGKMCGQAISGTVPESGDGFCDIYARQIDYRKSAKDFRESLDKRRKSYEQPRIDAINNYRDNMKAIFKEETKNYQKEIALQQESGSGNNNSDNTAAVVTGKDADNAEATKGTDEKSADNSKITDSSSVTDEAGVPKDEKIVDDGTGIKEKIIDSDENGQKVIKKVIMPDDAPSFDQNPF